MIFYDLLVTNETPKKVSVAFKSKSEDVVILLKDSTFNEPIKKNGVFNKHELKELSYRVMNGLVIEKNTVLPKGMMPLNEPVISTHLAKGGKVLMMQVMFMAKSCNLFYDFYFLIDKGESRTDFLENMFRQDLEQTIAILKGHHEGSLLANGFTMATLAFITLMAVLGFVNSSKEKKLSATAQSEPVATSIATDTQSHEQLALQGKAMPNTQASSMSSGSHDSPQKTAVLSPKDMTAENMVKHEQNITEEVRRQVLAEMGINLDEIETLNDCKVE